LLRDGSPLSRGRQKGVDHRNVSAYNPRRFQLEFRDVTTILFTAATMTPTRSGSVTVGARPHTSR
jgi:hypothetical protein